MSIRRYLISALKLHQFTHYDIAFLNLGDLRFALVSFTTDYLYQVFVAHLVQDLEFTICSNLEVKSNTGGEENRHQYSCRLE